MAQLEPVTTVRAVRRGQGCRPLPSDDVEREQANAQNHQIEVRGRQAQASRRKQMPVNAELRSLQSHPSNIPSNGLQLRDPAVLRPRHRGRRLALRGRAGPGSERTPPIGKGRPSGYFTTSPCLCWSLPAITTRWPCGWTNATSGPDSSITGCQPACRPRRRPIARAATHCFSTCWKSSRLRFRCLAVGRTLPAGQPRLRRKHC